jgi:hypothetical protein
MRLRHVDPYERRGRLYLAIARFATTRLGVSPSTNISWNLDPLLLKFTRGGSAPPGLSLQECSRRP